MFSPEIKNEREILAEFEENFPQGKEVFIGINEYTEMYRLETVGKFYNVYLEGDTKKLLPTIEKIEIISTGWFSSDRYILLSDGSRWKCVSNYSDNASTWGVGQSVIVAKDILSTEKINLINVDARYVELHAVINGDGQVVYYYTIDRRLSAVEHASLLK